VQAVTKKADRICCYVSIVLRYATLANLPLLLRYPDSRWGRFRTQNIGGRWHNFRKSMVLPQRFR
jgi:hypothetical protein